MAKEKKQREQPKSEGSVEKENKSKEGNEEEMPKLPADKQKIMDELTKFTKAVLEKHGKYIKAIVMMGSVAREEFKQTGDVDVFVVIDDTNFKISPESHDKIDDEVEKMAEKISKNLSVQPSYTLTEFWDYARVAHPII